MEQKFHIHLVSDSTGETLNAMANAALAQFEDVDVQVHSYALVRSEHQLSRALDHIAISPGLVFFTLVNPRPARDAADPLRASLNIACIDVLEGPVTDAAPDSWASPKPTRPAASMKWTSAIWTASRR